MNYKILSSSVLGGLGFFAASTLLPAQIVNPINVHITHKFVIANTTLPPGDYTFRMVPDTDLSAMTASDSGDTHEIEFLVRESQDNHRPKHSQLIFNKYGNHEVLEKIYEVGSKYGVAVVETSRLEKRWQKQGQKPVQHAEPPE